MKLIHIDDEIQILDVYEKALMEHFSLHEIRIKSYSSFTDFESDTIFSQQIDVFILDIFLEKDVSSGLSVIQKCRSHYPKALIFASSNTSDHTIIHKSLIQGADDFLPKELNPTTVAYIIKSKVLAQQKNQSMESAETAATGQFMKEIRLRIPHIIDSAINCVHLFGETGTGKEMIADLFETTLPSNTPFIRVNCGGISSSLMMSELFGHVKGAFTGATSDKKGLIEIAKNGWLFMDEVATLSPDAQVALLRAIDNQKIRAVGSTKDIDVRFRIISATNEPIDDLVKAGKFRQDLWQRLRETDIYLPPLRHRKDEISELVNYFCKTMRGGPYKLAPTVMSILRNHDWRDGNIRELRNCLRSMTEKATDRLLTPTCVPDRIWKFTSRPVTYAENFKDEQPRSNEITLSWQETTRPDFDKLCAMLLMQLIESEHKNFEKLSMRSLARALGIPKSSLPGKIRTIFNSGIKPSLTTLQLLQHHGDFRHMDI
jgi:DNA-binding NtrC family response regulator